MNEYCPDRYVIVRVEYPDDTHYRVFGSWMGGYLSGDSWRLNAGIVSISRDGEMLQFLGETGSVYVVHVDAYGMSSYAAIWLQSLIDSSPFDIEVLSEDESRSYCDQMMRNVDE